MGWEKEEQRDQETFMADLKYSPSSKEYRQVWDDLVRQHGEGFNSEDVYVYACSNDSPIHKCLEWNDRICGRKYRLDQCREIMRRMHFNGTEGEDTVISFKAKEKKRRGYWLIETIKSNKELKRDALKQLWTEANALLQKFKHFEEIFDIISPEKLTTFKEKYL